MTAAAAPAGGRIRSGWILSRREDLLVFGGPPLLAAVLVAAFASGGRLHDPLPPWAFALLIVGVDVAHVWSTLFRTYLDPEERARRPGLLVAVPAACFLAGTALYMADDSGLLFWRVLAYLAAFHFVRQQVGWMAFAGRRGGETSLTDRRLDRLAIYASTLFPLLWWHARLPRAFVWFVPGDFVEGTPPWAAEAGLAIHAAILGAWVARQAWRAARGGGVNGAKWLILGTTWATWFGGIVLLDSDVAFTATNVLAHGIPYLAVVRRYGRSRWRDARGVTAFLFRPAGAAAFHGLLFLLAFAEEGFWDRLVWHEHGGLFPGPAAALGPSVIAVVVPLLAVPQASHYVLDAFLWRLGPANPGLARHLAPPGGAPGVSGEAVPPPPSVAPAPSRSPGAPRAVPGRSSSEPG